MARTKRASTLESFEIAMMVSWMTLVRSGPSSFCMVGLARAHSSLKDRHRSMLGYLVTSPPKHWYDDSGAEAPCVRSALYHFNPSSLDTVVTCPGWKPRSIDLRDAPAGVEGVGSARHSDDSDKIKRGICR